MTGKFSRRGVLKAGAMSGLVIAGVGGAATPAAAKEPESGGAPGVGDVAYVDVAAATLWVEPDKDRKVDAPSLTNPVDLRAWLAAMSLKQRRWLIRNLETQGLYGQDVTVTAESGDWVHVVVHGQPTPRDERGYPGWVLRSQLTSRAPSGSDGPFAQVTDATTWLYDDATLSSEFMEISYGNRLPCLDQTDTALKVATPTHGDKWLSGDAATVYESEDAIPAPSGADLVADAKMFLGLPYLWAGTAGFGFDCSGLTHSLHKAHGVTIPRDSGPQKDAGTPVAAEEMRAGDLLFYGTDRIHHVGMHIGDGHMIDARTNTDKVEQRIEIVAVDEHPYAFEFAGAVRYLA